MYHMETKKAAPIVEGETKTLQRIVKTIIERVKRDGDKALRFYEKKFDGYEPKSFLVSREEARKAGYL